MLSVFLELTHVVTFKIIRLLAVDYMRDYSEHQRLLDHISNRNENKCIYHPYVGVELFIIHIIIVAYFHPGDICEYF